MEALRLEFPRSSVVWRTMHPGMKHSITPRVVADFNRAFRAAASALSPRTLTRTLEPLTLTLTLTLSLSLT